MSGVQFTAFVNDSTQEINDINGLLKSKRNVDEAEKRISGLKNKINEWQEGGKKRQQSGKKIDAVQLIKIDKLNDEVNKLEERVNQLKTKVSIGNRSPNENKERMESPSKRNEEMMESSSSKVEAELKSEPKLTNKQLQQLFTDLEQLLEAVKPMSDAYDQVSHEYPNMVDEDTSFRKKESEKKHKDFSISNNILAIIKKASQANLNNPLTNILSQDDVEVFKKYAALLKNDYDIGKDALDKIKLKKEFYEQLVETVKQKDADKVNKVLNSAINAGAKLNISRSQELLIYCLQNIDPKTLEVLLNRGVELKVGFTMRRDKDLADAIKDFFTQYNEVYKSNKGIEKEYFACTQLLFKHGLLVGHILHFLPIGFQAMVYRLEANAKLDRFFITEKAEEFADSARKNLEELQEPELPTVISDLIVGYLQPSPQTDIIQDKSSKEMEPITSNWDESEFQYAVQKIINLKRIDLIGLLFKKYQKDRKDITATLLEYSGVLTPKLFKEILKQNIDPKSATQILSALREKLTKAYVENKSDKIQKHFENMRLALEKGADKKALNFSKEQHDVLSALGHAKYMAILDKVASLKREFTDVVPKPKPKKTSSR